MNRKEFLKIAGLTGIAGTGLFGACQTNENGNSPFQLYHEQEFNMNGYAAPALDRVRVGIIGIGNRGSGAVRRLSRIDGVDINALCDLIPQKVNVAANYLKDLDHSPTLYSGGPDEWKRLCEQENIDLVYICTPWDWHASMSVFAMETANHVAVELPAAKTIEECWNLVKTSERTRKHCMLLGNVNYDFFELMVLNMVRNGFFGEIIHGEGAYIHNLIDFNFSKDIYENMWRLKENASRNGNLYPPHGIGPIAKAMNINCGDKMEYLVSMSSDDFSMAEKARELAEKDTFWEPYVGREYRGNINTSIIRTKMGRTIMLQHDVSSPRPYSRIHLISGTKAISRKWPQPSRIATGHDGWLPGEEMQMIEKKYTPEITKKVGQMAREIGGHGGMDTLMDWRLIDCLKNGLPLDIDVYDAVLWSAIAPLTEWSIANNFTSVKVPDFTSGSWKTNKPGMDINLERGGNTKLL